MLRVWPFAAMDYSIMFDSGPIDVLDKLDDHIAQKPWFHSCKKEPVNLVDFFVKRNSRERLALFRDERMAADSLRVSWIHLR